MIHSSRIPVGSRLPTEKLLMEQFRVGRPALREALRILEIRGLIRIQPGRSGGPVIARPGVDAVADSLAFLLAFRGVTLSDVLAARELFEPAMVARAAGRADEDDVDVLQRLATSLVDEVDHDATMSRRDAFHTKLAEVSGNPVLEVFADALRNMIADFDYGSGYSRERQRVVSAEHQAIADAVSRGDREAADRAARDHIRHSREYWASERPELMTTPLRLRNPMQELDEAGMC